MEDERLISNAAFDQNDEQTELSLRPQKLAQYIGQEKIKQKVAIYIEAAKSRQESLDHVLLYGPPGLGKTTL
ncbi:Holliday junction branch migration DNA helicase RuvB, partial [Campylobacter jejuni]|nr:Holliday junction branch migration DNA helicase RuvB [Campylobacter jejuni]